MTASRRDHLVETAIELFYRHGFHATGIDRILAQSGVAKMTLYKHFKSKDELILAALQRRAETFGDAYRAEIERRAASPRDRLLAVFDALHDWLAGDRFCGCLFINAAAEFAPPDHPVHAAAAAHKQALLAYLRDQAAAAGVPEPDRLARRLGLLHEGAIVTAQLAGTPEAASDAREAAEILLAAALA